MYFQCTKNNYDKHAKVHEYTNSGTETMTTVGKVLDQRVSTVYAYRGEAE